MTLTTRAVLLLSVLLVSQIGCKSYNIKPDITSEERLEVSKKMFRNGDYRQALRQLRIISLNAPGSKYIDEVQFLIAECHYEQEEYILAADEYNRLIRLYPRSDYLDDCYYKVGMCDYHLSPKPSLDQTHTQKAVINFQRFIEEFPDSELAPTAEKYLKVCRNKLSEKEFKSAELYRKMGDTYAAMVYYSSIVDNYYDTPFLEEALYWKGETLFQLDKESEAQRAFEEYIRRFPSSKFSRKVQNRLQTLAGRDLSSRTANGVNEDR